MRLLKILISCVLFLNLSTARAELGAGAIGACGACIGITGLLVMGASIGGIVASINADKINTCDEGLSACCQKNGTQITPYNCVPQTGNTSSSCTANTFPYCSTYAGYVPANQKWAAGPIAGVVVSSIFLAVGSSCCCITAAIWQAFLELVGQR